VGIRPEDMEDASLVPDAPADRRLSSGVMLREALGADVLVHFMIKAPAVITEDTKELAGDVGQEALEAAEKGAIAGESEFLARLNPRTEAKKGQPIELVVDVSRLHFFDPETGEGIYEGRTEPGETRSS
jgi:multiple sugar transport system ATP-binding protein